MRDATEYRAEGRQPHEHALIEQKGLYKEEYGGGHERATQRSPAHGRNLSPRSMKDVWITVVPPATLLDHLV
jgi:hypothetical protein